MEKEQRWSEKLTKINKINVNQQYNILYEILSVKGCDGSEI